MPRTKDSDLLLERNKALCRRYYYWTETQRLRFDDALRILSRQEFFLSEARIMTIIREMSSKMREEGLNVHAVPKVKKPKITAQQLELFSSS